MSDRTEQDARIPLELLAGNVLGDLSPEEIESLQEFERLDGESYRTQMEELERTAAALQIALMKGMKESMPDSLRQSILKSAPAMVVQRELVSVSSSKEKNNQTRNRSPREWVAWLTCAASLILSLSLWLFNREPIQVAIAIEKARDLLIEQSADLVRADWKEGKTPLLSSVTGDVVWSNLRQAGYMRFVGLPKNDPSKEQYQLWIIDPSRDDEPIDGGVFDISAEGVAIVPIDAKLKVLKPTAFAITVEKPGGVVVSTQERLPLLAVIP